MDEGLASDFIFQIIESVSEHRGTESAALGDHSCGRKSSILISDTLTGLIMFLLKTSKVKVALPWHAFFSKTQRVALTILFNY